MKTHWLYGEGPDKIVKYHHEIDEESNCKKCIHHRVCRYDMAEFCVNYKFGTSSAKPIDTCESCSHKYTRYDKEPIPCFLCKHIEEK